MTKRQLLRIAIKCSRLFGCHYSEIRGDTIGKLLRGAELFGGVTIAWGCFTDEDLAFRIPVDNSEVMFSLPVVV